MMMEELLKKAESLGVTAEGLSQKQLKAAIEKEEKRLAKLENFRKRAEKLNIPHEGVDIVDLINAVEDAERAEKEKELAVQRERKIALVSEFLDVDLDAVSESKLKALLNEKTANAITVEARVVAPEKGKTKKTFAAKDGKVYGFTDEAPAKFRYMGQLRTQEEWISDADAMEIMVAAKMRLVKQKK